MSKTYEELEAERLLEKIDSGEKLSERELRNLIWNYEDIKEREYGENRRWTRGVESIICLCGRYFSIYWEEGLTEYQENEYFYQPEEVEKHEYDKTIHVVEWVPKNSK